MALHSDHINDHEEDEFLNLSLSLGTTTKSNPYSSINTTTAKSNIQKQVFHCTKCSRCFLNSQALGGHMSAHRTNAKPTSTRFPLGVRAHASGLKPRCKERAKLVARFDYDHHDHRVQNYYCNYMMEEDDDEEVGLICPGHFRAPADDQDFQIPDLNL